MHRRGFITSAIAALGCVAARRLWAAPKQHAIGLQLYTLRDRAERNLPEVLRAVRSIGYEEVELYGPLYSRPATELRRMLSTHGLRAPSGHIDYDQMDAKLEYARDLGLTYVVCPMLPRSMWGAADEFKRAADQLNVWGAKAARLGMRFAYHNHNYEFRRFGDTTGFDILLERTDPHLVHLEIDCYWVTEAGRNPVPLLAVNGTRVRMLHIKDRKPGFPASVTLDEAAFHFTEVGTGTINWKEIVSGTLGAGVQHFFIEQDFTDKPALESIAISYRNLRKWL